MEYAARDTWVWYQDRVVCVFQCITTNHIVAYPKTYDKAQHDVELKAFETKFPDATVYQLPEK